MRFTPRTLRPRSLLILYCCGVMLAFESPASQARLVQSQLDSDPPLTDLQFGDWRFGMTEQEVQSSTSCHDYRLVSDERVGKVHYRRKQCSDFQLDASKVHVQFNFVDGRLDQIAPGFFGSSEKDARQVTASMLRYMNRHSASGVTSHEVAATPLDENAIFSYLLSHQRTPGRETTVRVWTVQSFAPMVVALRVVAGDRLVGGDLVTSTRVYVVSLDVQVFPKK